MTDGDPDEYDCIHCDAVEPPASTDHRHAGLSGLPETVVTCANCGGKEAFPHP